MSPVLLGSSGPPACGASIASLAARRRLPVAAKSVAETLLGPPIGRRFNFQPTLAQGRHRSQPLPSAPPHGARALAAAHDREREPASRIANLFVKSGEADPPRCFLLALNDGSPRCRDLSGVRGGPDLSSIRYVAELIGADTE